MTSVAQHRGVWLFGYGSIIYHVDFPYQKSSRATIAGWRRRFWQGSHDHRGTLDSPGRVVTLLHSPGVECVGRAYFIEPEVFAHLDHREKNGYERIDTNLTLEGGEVVAGKVYIAAEGNFAWLGDAPTTEIAHQIAHSAGPSGLNRDYLLHLADALRELETHDEHVFELERLLGGC